MYVLIAGGGRTGTQLARLLIKQEHEVRIIENRKDVLARILGRAPGGHEGRGYAGMRHPT